MKTTLGKLLEIVNTRMAEYFGDWAYISDKTFYRERARFEIRIAGSEEFYVCYSDHRIIIETFFPCDHETAALFKITDKAQWLKSCTDDKDDSLGDLKDRFVQAVYADLVSAEFSK